MASADRRLFRPFDLVFPILPTVLCATLCILIGLKAEDEPRWVSISTGIVFLVIGIVGWYWARYAFTHANYITKHGLYVVLGKQNRPEINMVEEWTDQCIAFWTHESLQKPSNPRVFGRDAVLVAIENVRCFFYDKKRVGWGFKLVSGVVEKIPFAGVARNNIQIVVGYWPEVPQFGVPGIFRHELSHIILGLNGVPSGKNYGDGHHEIFKTVGLGV